MTKQEIIKYFKNYKHKDKEVIKYVALNNSRDKNSPIDTKNIISKAVTSKDTKFISELISAIMDVKGEVKYDTKTKKYIIIEKITNTNVKTTPVDVKEVGDKINFIVNGNRKSIIFETPKAMNNFNSIKSELINELKKPNALKSKTDLMNLVNNMLQES